MRCSLIAVTVHKVISTALHKLTQQILPGLPGGKVYTLLSHKLHFETSISHFVDF
jgi:hypothetical protein